MSASRKHKPDDPYNCLCDECVYASLRRMGGPWKAVVMTRKEWFANRKRDREVSNGE